MNSFDVNKMYIPFLGIYKFKESNKIEHIQRVVEDIAKGADSYTVREHETERQGENERDKKWGDRSMT